MHAWWACHPQILWVQPKILDMTSSENYVRNTLLHFLGLFLLLLHNLLTVKKISNRVLKSTLSKSNANLLCFHTEIYEVIFGI